VEAWLGAIDGQSSDAEPFQKFEKRYKKFSIRVTASIEKNAWFASGADYVFESTAIGRSQWKLIMTFRHDDAVDIPVNQIRFLADENIAYVFMGWMYAVTTDGGNSWSVWNARSDLAGWQCCNYSLIKDVVIQPDGSGKMLCNPIPGRSGEVPKLFTLDFGRSWKPSPSSAEGD
jgi:hypothetical protein